MERQDFYLRSPSGALGPFNRTKLAALAADGRLSPTHGVSTDGKTWMPAQRVEGLFPNTGAGTPVAPAKSGNNAAIPAMTRDTSVRPDPVASPTAVPLRSSATPRKAVFISHCTDNAAVAREILSGLEAAGVPCWIAPRDITPGSDWGQGIMSGIQGCQLLLLLCSSEAFASRWVLAEVRQAEKRRIPILPVRLERAKPPDKLGLIIDEYQWIDAEGPMAKHMGKIVDGVKHCLGLAVAEPAEPDRSAMPKQIGHFYIFESLDDEGTGTTYLAEQREPVRRTVALKVIKPGVDTSEVIARFESDRQALVRMDHPNIARVLDAGTSEQGQPYFVTEYVPGKPIIEFADSHRLSIQARLELFLQVCDAISHAHSKAIIHRDIRPSNVLALFWEKRPTAKVINFGIAKALTGERLTDQTISAVRGARDPESYTSLSPEQARGSDDLDTRSDVYSLGALLYELLAGFKPFDLEALGRATDAEARRIICEVMPFQPGARLKALGAQAVRIAGLRQTTPSAMARKLRHELEWIPLMAMRKERQFRYASPLLLGEDIQNYLKSEPLDAVPKSKRYRFRKFARRNRAVLTPVIIFLLAIGLGTMFYVVKIRAAEGKAERHEKNANEQKQIAIEQKQIAIKQEQVAKTVNQFLSEMLTSASPNKGNELKIVEAIKVFTKSLVNGRLKDQPAVEASIRDTIGDVLRSLADSSEEYDVADDNLQQAINKYHEARPNFDGADIAKVLDHRGHLFKDWGKYLQDASKKEDKDKRKLSENEAAEKYAQALKDYDTALEIYQRLPPDDVQDLATALYDRALLLYSRKQDLEAAERNCREALRIRQGGKAAPDPDIIQSMGTLVDILREEGPAKYPTADELINEALAKAAKSLSKNDPNLARLKIQQGMLLKDEGNLDTAEKVCREALDIDIQTLPPGHRYVENARQKLNDVLKKLNKPEVTPADVAKRQEEAEKQQRADELSTTKERARQLITNDVSSSNPATRSSGENRVPATTLAPVDRHEGTVNPSAPAPSDTLFLQAGQIKIVLMRFPPAGVTDPPDGRGAKYLGETDVTNAQFAEFLRNNPDYKTAADKRFKSGTTQTEQFSYVYVRNRSTREEKIDLDIKSWKDYPGDDLPVVMVSRDDAVAFCSWLEKKTTGFAVRLPSADEWKVACQAGTKTQYWWGDNGSDGAGKKINVLANPKDEFVFQRPVKTYPANPWGFYDILGNVEQWTGDEVNHQGYATTVGWSWQDTAGDMSPRLRHLQLCNDRIGFRILAIKNQ